MTKPDFSGRYTKQFLCGWAMMDANGHLANTAYLSLASDIRVSYFNEHGFPAPRLRELGIGPVVGKDEVEYFRELHLHDVVTVTYVVTGMSADGSRFAIENEIWSPKGERSAVVRASGGWLDLRARKLIVPPPDLLAAFRSVPKSPDFIELPNLTSRG